MQEDQIWISSDDIKMPTRIGALTFRGKEYEPAPNRRAKGWLEWNVAPDGEPGPAPIYGEKVTIQAETDYRNMHYTLFWCCPYTQVESGHPTQANYTTQLLIPGASNPECIILEWNNKANGLVAMRKEDFLSKNTETTPLLKSEVQSHVQKEIKAVEKWVDSLPQEEIIVQGFQMNLRAAEKGDMKAQTLIAHSYHLGSGVTKDPTQAAYWYRKAAEQGDEGAKKILLSRYNTKL